MESVEEKELKRYFFCVCLCVCVFIFVFGFGSSQEVLKHNFLLCAQEYLWQESEDQMRC